MPRVDASIVVPGRVAEAEALWYDQTRWPAWVDGFGHVVALSDDWPAAGSKSVWDSRPGGRSRVIERVLDHSPGAGQTAEVEDEQLRGTQSVAFAPAGENTLVTLALDFTLKERKAILATLFVRRAVRESLERTLRRFAIERESDFAG